MLADGQGGIQWAGLPIAIELYGVSDVDGLVHRLTIIKQHEPPKD